jgi:hypothetical protein
VNRYPDSLLHSLLSSVETKSDNAPLELDLSSALSSSQLSTFTESCCMWHMQQLSRWHCTGKTGFHVLMVHAAVPWTVHDWGTCLLRLLLNII